MGQVLVSGPLNLCTVAARLTPQPRCPDVRALLPSRNSRMCARDPPGSHVPSHGDTRTRDRWSEPSSRDNRGGLARTRASRRSGRNRIRPSLPALADRPRVCALISSGMGALGVPFCVANHVNRHRQERPSERSGCAVGELPSHRCSSSWGWP
jgi:hypothetical protein